MPSRFRHAALVGKYQTPGIGPMLEDIAQLLIRRGLEVSIEAATALNTGLSTYNALTPDELGKSCDIAIVVGGDGTMLGIARHLARYGVPLVGVNQGRLGFITDIPVDDVHGALDAMLHGDYEEEYRSMIEGRVVRDGESIFEAVAMNDVVLRSGATAMLELRVSVDDEFITNMRADGLILSSPTGSTAYSLSAGGPILHPSVAGWLLVPIASHMLSNRPIVLPDSGEVSIEIVNGREPSANFDMQSFASLMAGDKVCMRRSAHRVRFLHPRGWNYYATLRRKLHWNEGAPPRTPDRESRLMLRRLSLRDFVIVTELEVDLPAGFTALTGETGAGKSILIDAVQLALGARGEALVVREGAQRADISAEFDALPAAARSWLEEAGFSGDEAEAASVLVRRVVDRQGKSRAWINGSAATLTQLRELGEWLVDIHGQHAWAGLTRPASVRALLDAYAGIDTAPLSATWTGWRAAQTRLDDARRRSADLERERERLSWQIGELDKLAPGADEWTGLNAEHQRLAHAQTILDAVTVSLEAVQAADTSALSLTDAAIAQLQDASRFDPTLRDALDVLHGARAQLDDVAHTLRGASRHTELDPQRLAELDARMGSWVSLARRYRRQPDELPGLLQGWRDELAALDAASDLEGLARACNQAQARYQAAAEHVSRARRQAAPRLALAVTAAMQQLGMAGGRFEVALEMAPEPQAHGLEQVEFRVAGHAGSTPRPLGKVASGGELSRIALAIAVTTSELGIAGTLIFDEVDAGVGGEVAQTVGRLMQRLGRDRQVLTVTHLAQVAACAHAHLVVSKAAHADGTRSQVRPVQAEMRVAEVARMLGGQQNDMALAHARDMLRAGSDAGSDAVAPNRVDATDAPASDASSASPGRTSRAAAALRRVS